MLSWVRNAFTLNSDTSSQQQQQQQLQSTHKAAASAQAAAAPTIEPVPPAADLAAEVAPAASAEELQASHQATPPRLIAETQISQKAIPATEPSPAKTSQQGPVSTTTESGLATVTPNTPQPRQRKANPARAHKPAKTEEHALPRAKRSGRKPVKPRQLQVPPPPAVAAMAGQRVYQEGDLIWAQSRGNPWWPGQVMDPVNAPGTKTAKPNRQLISFFGDNTHGWFSRTALVDFEEHYEDKHKQKTQNKDFPKAVEEAKEILEKRAGRTPATHHNPHDFLDADDQRNAPASSSDEELEEDIFAGKGRAAAKAVSLGPMEPLAPLTEASLQLCSAQLALAWLRAAARAPTAADDSIRPEEVDSAQRQLFSLAQQLWVKPVGGRRGKATPEGKLKRKRGAGKGGEKAPRRRKLVRLDGRRERAGSEGLDGSPAMSNGDNGRADAEEDGGYDADVRTPAPKRRSKDTSAAKPPRVRQLVVELAHVAELIRDMARDLPQYLAGAKAAGTEGAAFARFRELAFSHSKLTKGEAPGEFVEEALAGPDVEQKTIRKAREKKATKQPKPKMRPLGDTYRLKQYVDKVPESAEALQAALQEFAVAQGHKAALPKLIADPQAAFTLFKAIAQRGGYEAVSATRQWSKVCVECFGAEVSMYVKTNLKPAYAQHLLLLYEDALSADAPCEVKVRKTAAPKSLGQARSPSGDRKPKRQKKGTGKAAATDAAAARQDAAAEAPATQAEPMEPSEDEQDEDEEEEEEEESEQEASADSEEDEQERKRLSKGVNLNRLPKEGETSAAERRQAPVLRSPAEKKKSVQPVLDAARRLELAKKSRQRHDFGELQNDAAPPVVNILPPKKDAPAPKEKRPENCVVLRFPEGHMMPSTAQVLIHAQRFGAIAAEDIRISRQHYLIALRYRTEQDARPAHRHFSRHAHTIFPTAPGKRIQVALEAVRVNPKTLGQRNPKPRTLGRDDRRPQEATSRLGAAQQLPHDPRQPARWAGAAPSMASTAPADPRRPHAVTALQSGPTSLSTDHGAARPWNPQPPALQGFNPAHPPQQLQQPPLQQQQAVAGFDLMSILQQAGVQPLAQLGAGAALPTDAVPPRGPNPMAQQEAGATGNPNNALPAAQTASGNLNPDVSTQLMALLGQLGGQK